MNFNPLVSECAALKKAIAATERKVKRAIKDLDWYSSFDVAAEERAQDREEAEVASLRHDLAVIQRQVRESEEQIQQLAKSAAAGWNPRRWFSQQRREARRDLKSRQAEHDVLESRVEATEQKISRHDSARILAQKNLKRFHGIEKSGLRDEIARLTGDLAIKRLELDDLDKRRQLIDERIKEPLKQLESYRREITELEEDIAYAEQMDAQLSCAANGRERRLIHEWCGQQFGASSPRGVMSTKQRKLVSVRRNVQKTERRLTEISHRMSRDIRALVIDGNNLCYQGNVFIGLSALQPLCACLATKREVTVVFDASIRRRLCMGDDKLRLLLPEAAVHIVAARRAADETILDAAQDAYVYVVSNDRFGEFQEKPAVYEDRLLRHEIINGRILIHDLGVDERFYTSS